jgi:type I restriction enzyme, S subunit
MKQLMDGWRWNSIHELTGGVPANAVIGPFGSDLKASDYTDEGVPLVFVRNIRASDFEAANGPRISAEKAAKLRAHEVRTGDLLVTKMGDPPGDAAIYSAEEPAIITADCIRLRLSADFDPRFIAHSFSSELIRQQIDSITRGAAQRKVSLDRLRESVRIPTPPISEQKRIADILDRADALRAKRREAIALLSDLTESIFLEMFGDPIANPYGFDRPAFGEVCETRLGKMLDARQQTGLDKRKYLRNANVQWFRFELDDLLEMDIDERSRKLLRLRPGDVLICEGGEPGRAAVWEGQIDECYFQKALHRARPHPELAEPLYIAWFLRFASKRGALKDYITSATIAHLTGEKLRTLPLLLPSLDRQQAFAARVRAVEAARSIESDQAEQLEDAFRSLQQAAFAGTLT